MSDAPENKGEQPPLPERGRPHRFAQGQSGNPGGRPKELLEVRALIRQYGEPIVKALIATAIDRTKKDHVKAGLGLLAYAYGKPPQNIQLSGADGGPVALSTAPDIATSAEKRSDVQVMIARALGIAPAQEAPGAAEADPGAAR